MRSGTGPDGMRADFLKGAIGQSLELEVLQEFLQIFVDAEVPDVKITMNGRRESYRDRKD